MLKGIHVTIVDVKEGIRRKLSALLHSGPPLLNGRVELLDTLTQGRILVQARGTDHCRHECNHRSRDFTQHYPVVSLVERELASVTVCKQVVPACEKELLDNIDDSNVTIGAGPEWNIVFLIVLRKVS